MARSTKGMFSSLASRCATWSPPAPSGALTVMTSGTAARSATTSCRQCRTRASSRAASAARASVSSARAPVGPGPAGVCATAPAGRGLVSTQATVASSIKAAATPNVSRRPSWNGPEMTCGKNAVLVTVLAVAAGIECSAGPSSDWIGL